MRLAQCGTLEVVEGRFCISSSRRSGTFLQSAFLEMLDCLINVDPMMLRPLEYRKGGSRKAGVAERANRDADERWQDVGLPIDRRAACWTKIASHLTAAIADANELRSRSRDLDGVNRMENAEAEWRTGSSLAGETVTRDNQL
jgi:hypothetical protein